MSIAILDLIAAAYLEFNFIAAGEPVPDEDAVFALNKMNLILDEWAGDEFYVYNTTIQLFNYTANHQPTLIGPTAVAPDFVLPGPRPVGIRDAGWMLGTVRVPLDILDDDGWSSTSIKTQKAVTPLKLYYTPNVPNGSIFLWPIPTTSSQVELEMENLLQQVADLNTQLDLPTGYQAAMTLTLAETLEHSLGFPPTPGLVAGANRARLKIQQRNVESPRSGTRDVGMPGGKATSWNFRTGPYRRG
jgi:hypothetical protein